jgi:thioesterase domain-containing protein/acyl carrier protein
MVAKILPPFMVPRSITILDALPRLPNFKIDREELRRRDQLEREHSSPPVEPNNKIQETLLKIWRDVLNRHDIGCDDDFFLCGGDSLGAVQLLAEVAEVYGVVLAIDVLFDAGATVAGMAKTIEAARSRVRPLDRRPASTVEKVTSSGAKNLDEVVRRLRLTANSWPGVNIGVGIPIFTLNPQGKLPPIFWCFNVPAEPKEMARVLGPDRPIYAMRSLNNVMIDKRDKERFIEALGHLYTDEILQISKSGPYFIGGNCQSGPFAESIAHLLMGQGRGVAQLTLLEYEPRAAYPGRVALFFGAQSVSYNPFFTKVAPEETWKRLHKEVVWDIIPGNHGQYFEMPNLATFMDRLQARLAEAQT